MIKPNQFDRKSIEKSLFAAYMPAAVNKRRLRTYLRKAARDIEHGYIIGKRDAQAGKPMVQAYEIPELTDCAQSEMRRDIYRRTYAAYVSGYQAERKGV